MSAEVPAPHPGPEQFHDGLDQPLVEGDGFEALPDQGDGFELPEPVNDGFGPQVAAEDDGFGSTSNAQFNYYEAGEHIGEGGDRPIRR